MGVCGLRVSTFHFQSLSTHSFSISSLYATRGEDETTHHLSHKRHHKKHNYLFFKTIIESVLFIAFCVSFYFLCCSYFAAGLLQFSSVPQEG